MSSFSIVVEHIGLRQLKNLREVGFIEQPHWFDYAPS
jgi:hypothetical protein